MSEAVALMRRNKVVCEADRLVGILTERDVMRRVIASLRLSDNGGLATLLASEDMWMVE